MIMGSTPGLTFRRLVFYDVVFAGVILLIISNLSFVGLCITWYFQGTGEVLHERKLLTPFVSVGGNLRISIKIKRITECESVVRRTIIDSKRTPWEKSPEPQPNYVGEVEFIQYISIPLGAAAGPAIYQAEELWKCNPLQQVFPHTEFLEPISFVIMRPIPSGPTVDTAR